MIGLINIQFKAPQEALNKELHGAVEPGAWYYMWQQDNWGWARYDMWLHKNGV